MKYNILSVKTLSISTSVIYYVHCSRHQIFVFFSCKIPILYAIFLLFWENWHFETLMFYTHKMYFLHLTKTNKSSFMTKIMVKCCNIIKKFTYTFKNVLEISYTYPICWKCKLIILKKNWNKKYLYFWHSVLQRKYLHGFMLSNCNFSSE